MTNLDSIWESRDITLLTKAHIVKAVIFSAVMYECEGWTIKKTKSQGSNAFDLWCWRRLLRVSWTARRSNQSILKKINREHSLEGLMLRLQYFGHLMPKSWLIGKDPDAGKDWRLEEKGTTEDKMIRLHPRLNGHEFEQAPRDGERQGSLACCSPWGCEESDTTKWLSNNTIFSQVFH